MRGRLRGWTGQDSARLSEVAGTMAASVIARELGRTTQSVKMRMRVLGLRGYKSGGERYPVEKLARGTAEQRTVVREMAGKVPVSEIAARLGVVDTTVRTWARLLDVDVRVVPQWTPDLDAKVRELARVGRRAIAQATGRSEGAVLKRAQHLGVSIARERKPEKAPRLAGWRAWSADEDAVLRQWIAAGACDMAGLAARLERTPVAIQKRMSRIALAKPRARHYGGDDGVIADRRPAAARTTGLGRVRACETVVRTVSTRGELLRQRACRGRVLEYCRCGSPVSNWIEHFERVGHTRERMLRA